MTYCIAMLFSLSLQGQETNDSETGAATMQGQQNYTLALFGFKPSELDNLNAYMLSNALNQQFRLLSAVQSDGLFSSYLPLIDHQYTLNSGLSPSQLQQMLQRYFQQQGLKVGINLQSKQHEVVIHRAQNPYTVYIVSSALAVGLLLAFVLLRLRRRLLHARYCQREQSLANDVAQAMQLYRQKQLMQALQLLYQSHQNSLKEKGLREQRASIDTLIGTMLSESLCEVTSLVITSKHAPVRLWVYGQSKLYLGRISNTPDIPWVDQQHARYYIGHKYVSRIGQHCFFTRTEHGFQLIDTASKNGTFLNDQRCVKHQSYQLHSEDLVQLGSSNKASSVNLRLKLGTLGTILRAEFLTTGVKANKQQDFNRLWPDNQSALCDSLIMTQQESALVLNTSSKCLELQDSTELEHLSARGIEQSCIVAILSLGKNASIAPYQANNTWASNKLAKAKINGQALIGKMPLTLPITLCINKLSFELRELKQTPEQNIHGDANLAEFKAIDL